MTKQTCIASLTFLLALAVNACAGADGTPLTRTHGSDTPAAQGSTATTTATTGSTGATTSTPATTNEPAAADDAQGTQDRAGNVPAAPARACTTDTDAVTAGYEIVLLREPDAPGLAFWVGKLGNGLSRHDMLEGLVGSKEFLDERVALDDEHFVTSLYTGFLGRGPDPDGIGHYLAALAHGTSRLDVALAFVRSTEFANPASPVHACFF